MQLMMLKSLGLFLTWIPIPEIEVKKENGFNQLLAFRDQEGSRYSLNEPLEAFKQDNDPPSDQWNTLASTLARGAEDGVGHAVTVVGWDDNFEPLTVNKIADFFDAYEDKFDQESDQNLWLELRSYLDG